MKREHRSISDWRKYLRFWGRDVERDIDDELQFHLEMREQDLIAEGHSPSDAHDETMRRFGSVDEVTRELRTHDMGRERSRARGEVFGTLLQDVKYGTRKLWQSPGFSLAVVIVLALGIGVNSAIFSAVDAALLRPLPFKDADRLAVLNNVRPPSEMRVNGVPAPKRAPNLNDVAELHDVVESMASYAPGALNMTGVGSPVRVNVALATTNFFSLLGTHPLLGRGFVDNEGDGKTSDVAVLSYSFWRGNLGADTSIVGKSITLNGSAFTVVGVMPAKFVVPAGTDMWLPLQLPFRWQGAAREAFKMYLPLQTIVKLAPGMDAATAGNRVHALFAPYATAKAPIRYTAAEMVLPMQSTIVQNRRTALLVLMGAAALVLLTACANVTNLLLARAASRRREMDIRAALGASRGRIVRQLLTESLLLSVAGGVLGVALAYSGLTLLTTLLPAQLVELAPPTIDLRVLGFSLLLSTTTGVLFGLWPAFGAARRAQTGVSSRKAGSYAATSRDGRTLRSIFVISEMAFALMLLVGAGLMLRSFRALISTNSGVEIDRVASVDLALPDSRYSTTPSQNVFYDALLERLRRIPGVTGAAVTNQMPLRGESSVGLSAEAEGHVGDPNASEFYPEYLRVSPEYFRVMGIRMLGGRSVSDLDNPKQAVAVINERMAKRLWPGEDAVGKRFAFGTMPGDVPSYITVVGVVADVRSRSLDTEPTAQMYLPFRDSPSGFSGIVVRGTGDPKTLLTAMRTAVAAVDPTQPISNLQMLEEAVAKTVAPRRTNTLLIAMFGVLAVVLAAFGVYAVIGYGVAQRTREIGIRIALGAQVQSVVGMVVREGLVLGLIGVAVGLAGAWVMSRLLQSLLFEISNRDPFTFVAAPILLIGIVVAATLIPARAASRVDPVKAIRME